MVLRVILLEVQDVFNLGSTEGVDGLRVISHHTYVLVPLTEFLQYKILGEVRILILVDHDIVEPSCNRLQGSRIVTKQDIHIQQDIIEVHDTCLLAFLRIQLIDIAYAGLLGGSIVLQGIRIAAVCIRSDKIVLRHRDARKHILRLIDLLVKLKILKTRLYRANRVACIIDREGLRIP